MISRCFLAFSAASIAALSLSILARTCCIWSAHDESSHERKKSGKQGLRRESMADESTAGAAKHTIGFNHFSKVVFRSHICYAVILKQGLSLIGRCQGCYITITGKNKACFVSCMVEARQHSVLGLQRSQCIFTLKVIIRVQLLGQAGTTRRHYKGFVPGQLMADLKFFQLAIQCVLCAFMRETKTRVDARSRNHGRTSRPTNLRLD